MLKVHRLFLSQSAQYLALSGWSKQAVNEARKQKKSVVWLRRRREGGEKECNCKKHTHFPSFLETDFKAFGSERFLWEAFFKACEEMLL